MTAELKHICVTTPLLTSIGSCSLENAFPLEGKQSLLLTKTLCSEQTTSLQKVLLINPHLVSLYIMSS